MVFGISDLHVRRRDRLAIVLGWPAHQANAVLGFAAHGIEYRPWRFCVTAEQQLRRSPALGGASLGYLSYGPFLVIDHWGAVNKLDELYI
jgi:hypothetical protein